MAVINLQADAMGLLLPVISPWTTATSSDRSAALELRPLYGVRSEIATALQD